MSVVVLKYAAKDRKKGFSVVTALKEAGLDVEGPDDGRALDLDGTSCLVLLWSEAAARSPTAQHDVQQAVQAWSSGRLVLLLLDDTELPVGLRDLSAIGMPSDGAGWADLVGQIQSVRAQPTLPDRRNAVAAGNNGRKALIRTMFWISACALVMLGAVLGWRSYSEPEETRDLGATSSDISYVIAFVILGAIVGAVTMWAWSLWQQRRKPAVPSQAETFEADATSMPPRIFVSYSRRDAAVVENLVKDIERTGHGVWIDRNSEGAQRYAAAIVSAIKNAELIALMGSRNAFASDHVIREIYVAGDHKKRFVVFQLDQSDFPDEVLYFTSGFPRISVSALDHPRLRNELSRLLLADGP